jgi:hypothetical protein
LHIFVNAVRLFSCLAVDEEEEEEEAVMVVPD